MKWSHQNFAHEFNFYISFLETSRISVPCWRRLSLPSWKYSAKGIVKTRSRPLRQSTQWRVLWQKCLSKKITGGAVNPTSEMCISVRQAGEKHIPSEKRPADLTSLSVKTTSCWCSLRLYYAHMDQITPRIFETALFERHNESHLRDEDAESWKSLKCAQKHSWQVASTRFKSRQADSKYCLNRMWHSPDKSVSSFTLWLTK